LRLIDQVKSLLRRAPIPKSPNIWPTNQAFCCSVITVKSYEFQSFVLG